MSMLIRASAALATLLLAVAAHAQTYPSRPVRIIVPFPPGGTTDILARVTAERLQSALGQPFIVENRSGAGGVIGTEVAAKAAPDGHTLMLSSSAPLAVGLKLYKKIPYDVMRDFTPVAMIADVTVLLVSSPSFKPQNVKEVIAYAKANPGKLNAGLPAVGSMQHLLMELFRLRTDTTINMIPYKGSGPVVVDLLAGVVDTDFENLPVVIEYIKANRLRALAVASEKRSELLPDTPTFLELGLPDLVAAPWFALVAPAGTPKEIVDRLNVEVNKMLRAPNMKALLEKQGANAIIATPEEARDFFQKEIDKWAKVVIESGAKID
jgi:tripartite-type tricarboxylate transporter receptor subunit TctC